MSIYNFSAVRMNGQPVSLKEYEGKVVLIFNGASQCGFTYQYKDLQALHDEYKEQGLVLLGFPCNQFDNQEPGENDKIEAFCTMNYGVTFPMFQKIRVRDEEAHPLFEYLASKLPFEGFNEEHFVAKILLQLLHEKHPHYLHGDSIKWNFTKFLIDKNGNPVKRFESTSEANEMRSDIERLLQS
ncbi:glutathione peroxidase [Paenibacillus turpanensis]|uniref:glutathione peroxidase n=1 Tax=Paenibacillus turpanensis TaxID=2689078 RepID=UPI00140C7F8C|nr:glutathione peroxidase [Paenibacillus turpanensis]